MDLTSEVEIGGHPGHSDHEAFEFKISVDRRKSASKTSTLDTRRADFRLLRELVSKDGDGHLTNRDRDKAEVFNAFFASVFDMDDEPRGSQCSDLEDHDCENDQTQQTEEMVRDLLLQLDPYKSLGPDGIHPRILKELAGVIIKSLSMIFEWSWKSQLTGRGYPNAVTMLCSVYLQFKNEIMMLCLSWLQTKN
ncbi:hypothetical protein WISP_41053 [Willisornis vidua]|uniref:Uncharacterized protein n=1 Tax=Willisornis vidua TaxID=1566151 RepID=A0ABQ9DMM0_9PASS|nr:hypothetical protein WISP_41053 [Willisornis vidua]